MSKSKEKQRAEDIQLNIIESCNYVDSDDIKITHDISEYTDSRRNSSRGEVAVWVLVEVPVIPEIKSDSYYQKNPHLKKPSEDSIEKTKNRVEIIKSVCQKVAQINQAEYLGYSSPRQGYDSTTTKTRYLNIKVE